MRKIRTCWEEKKPLCLYKGESLLNKQINDWKILGYHSTKEKPSGSRVDWLCQCMNCGMEKPIPMYNVISGRSKMCFLCANKDRHGEKNHNWKGTGCIPSSVITSIKNSAKCRNIPMEVTPEYLNTIWDEQKHKCALTGLDLIMKAKSKTDTPWSNTASLDRKNSSVGYVIGNVRWVHPVINMMKNHFSDETFISMCNRVTSWVACSGDKCEIVDLTN
jgi:hypothetical protein